MIGNIFAVFQRFEGALLVESASIGDEVLYVETLRDFDEDGGKALITNRHRNRSHIHYTGIDDDLTAITGVTLADDVTLLDKDFPADETEVRTIPFTRHRYAEVQASDEDDTITARVPHNLHQHLRRGTRDNTQWQTETVVCKFDGVEWVVRDVLGHHARLANNAASPIRILRYKCEDFQQGFVGIVEDDFSGTAVAVRCAVDQPPTSQATFTLLFNGTNEKVMHIKKGHERSHMFGLSEEFVETDEWSVEQTDPADCGGNLWVYLFIELDVDD